LAVYITAFKLWEQSAVTVTVSYCIGTVGAG